MGMTFWAIIVAALFVLAVVALIVLGAKYLREQKHSRAGTGRTELESSADKPRRDRREREMETGGEAKRPEARGGGVRVYRH